MHQQKVFSHLISFKTTTAFDYTTWQKELKIDNWGQGRSWNKNRMVKNVPKINYRRGGLFGTPEKLECNNSYTCNSLWMITMHLAAYMLISYNSYG